MSSKTKPVSPETFASMLAMAEQAARECAITREFKGQDHLCTADVFARDGQIVISVPSNALYTKAVCRDLLIRTRAAVAKTWNDAGLAWCFKRQRTGNEWTWVHRTGFWHMGCFDVTSRYAVMVPGEKIAKQAA